MPIALKYRGMTENEFRAKYPDLKLQCGKSSEDNKWWADARRPGGRCVVLSGRASLSQVLTDLDVALRNSRSPMASAHTLGLRYEPTLPTELTTDIINHYGLVEDMEPDETQEE